MWCSVQKFFRINTSTVNTTEQTNTIEKSVATSSACQTLVPAFHRQCRQQKGSVKELSSDSQIVVSLLVPSSDTNLLFVALGEGVSLLSQLGQHPLQPGEVILELFFQILILLFLILFGR